ncbi:MAG: SdrD B-like domain-containing protein, partial [Planctomycetota bacterium]
KTVDNATPQPGVDNATFTITVTNGGSSTATGVTATDTLPAGLNFVSGTGPTGAALTANGQVVDVSVGTLAAGTSATFTVVASVTAGTTNTLSNTVVVATPLTETNANNNTATSDVTPSLSSISGTVFVDANNNGIQDTGENPIAGVTLNLTGTDVNNNTVNQTVVTDASGNYNFPNLAAGTYTVTQTQPANFDDGIDTPGTGATGNVDTTVNDQFTFDLGPGVAAPDFDFAEVNEPFSKRRFLASS